MADEQATQELTIEERVEAVETHLTDMSETMSRFIMETRELMNRLHRVELKTQSLSDRPARKTCPHCGRIVSNPNAKICPTCSKPI